MPARRPPTTGTQRGRPTRTRRPGGGGFLHRRNKRRRGRRRVGSGCRIDRGGWIDRRALVGDHVFLGDDVYMGSEAVLGSRVHAGSHLRIGERHASATGSGCPGTARYPQARIPDARTSRGSSPRTRKTAHGPDPRMAA